MAVLGYRGVNGYNETDDRVGQRWVASSGPAAPILPLLREPRARPVPNARAPLTLTPSSGRLNPCSPVPPLLSLAPAGACPGRSPLARRSPTRRSPRRRTRSKSCSRAWSTWSLKSMSLPRVIPLTLTLPAGPRQHLPIKSGADKVDGTASERGIQVVQINDPGT